MTTEPVDQALRSAFAPTGKLRAVINLGNPVHAGTDPRTGSPCGVSVDIARCLATHLGLPLELVVVDGASQSVDAVASGQADVGFFAIDPSSPAFDNQGVATFPGGMSENTLFGTRNQAQLNFSEFAWNSNSVAGDGSGRDDTGYLWSDYVRLPSTSVDNQVKLINPMRYLDTQADTAPYWYVRHGTRDRDTSFTVSINLARKLADDKRVRDLDYRLAWDQPHAGNYDVPEAMAWIAASLKAASSRKDR